MELKNIILIVVCVLMFILLTTISLYYFIHKRMRANFSKNSILKKYMPTIKKSGLLNKGSYPTIKQEKQDLNEITCYFDGNVFKYLRGKEWKSLSK